MRFFYLSLLLMICSLQCVVGQEQQIITLSGVMLSSEGEPLPGVNILIKGTNNGTVTDLNGYYSLEAPVGSTLVISAIGFTTYEVKVRQERTSQNKHHHTVKLTPIKRLPSAYTVKQEQGVAVLSDSSVGFEVEGNQRNNRQQMQGPLAKIKYRDKNGKPTFILVPSYVAQRRRTKLRLEYTTALNRSVANKLPKLQSTYAQGRSVKGSLQVRGLEEQEIFSWGPAMNSLSLDASGNLVPVREDLSSAQVYNPYQVFSAGISTDNHLQLFSQISDFNLRGGYGFKTGQGIIPENMLTRHTVDFSGSANFYPVQPRVFLSYSQAEERLPQRGANRATILGSIYTTPPSFDLLQGETSRKPWHQTSTYLTPQGEELSYAPGLVNHPYWLINRLPDRRKEEKFLSGVAFNTNLIYPLRLQYNLVLDHQKLEDWFGLPLQNAGFEAGKLTHRVHQNLGLNSNLNTALDIDLYSDYWDMDVYAAYLFSYKQEELIRQDGVDFTQSGLYALEHAAVSKEFRLEPFRRQHEVITRANIYFSPNYYYRFIEMALSNRMYFSNTLTEQAAYFLPAASLKVNLGSLDFIKYTDFISQAEIYGTYASTLQEAPLLYNQWHFNSLTYTPSNYRQYYEDVELSSTSNLLPEEQRKWEIGTNLGFWGGLFDMNVSYYHHLTTNLILPVNHSSGFILQNVADIVTPGLEVALKANKYFEEGNWSAGLTFSRSKPRVKSLYGQQERIPIAGFETISTNLIEGAPVGMLVGTRYLRNEHGKKIIGEDGFPVVDPQLGQIGNPNPDWMAGIDFTLDYKNLSFHILLEGRRGGDVWNGTHQFLNYYGNSYSSAEQRNVKAYVFEGVTSNGEVNQQPIDFYNPAQPIEANRWVRYGEAGVAEEAIEDASLLRINEIQLGYDLTRSLHKLVRLQKVKVSLLARNLLLYTAYSGVDPVGNLFGYQQARGLDLFNQPNTRSYGVVLTLNI